MKTSLILLTALMLSPLAGAAESPEGMKSQALLDGTRWNIKAIPADKTAKEGVTTFEETLVFNNRQLSLGKTDTNTFGAADYKMAVKNGRQEFSATLKSDSEGTAKYSGWVANDRVKGTVEWKHKDGKTVKYEFEGPKESN